MVTVLRARNVENVDRNVNGVCVRLYLVYNNRVVRKGTTVAGVDEGGSVLFDETVQFHLPQKALAVRFASFMGINYCFFPEMRASIVMH